MTKISGVLDKWRDYFKTANSDIFSVIEYAVMVAAIDSPKEFKLKRDRIAELLFTCKFKRCFGCDKVELAVPNANDDDEDDKGTRKCKNDFVSEFGARDVNSSKESKSSRGSNQIEMNVNQISSYSYDEAEALTDELEEESQTLGEVLRIKAIIDNSRDESDSAIYECLRRLQLMALSVETLKATEIGKSVNALRKRSSNNIRHLVRTLVDNWKVMVDEWVNATAAFTESTPESMKASVVDEEEEGLPSPPLEDLAFFTTQTAPIEFSQFFDGMDDDGNLQNSEEFNKNHENSRRALLENNNPVQKRQFTGSVTAAPKDRKGEQLKKQSLVVKQNKPFGGESGPGRPTKRTFERKLNNDEMKLQQKSDQGTIQKRPVPTQQNKLKCPDEDADHVKLEAAKRKLQERYQEAEKAKRQRTIQVMELHDIPKHGLHKQGSVHKNAHMRSGHHNRHWANGRR